MQYYELGFVQKHYFLLLIYFSPHFRHHKTKELSCSNSHSVWKITPDYSSQGKCSTQALTEECGSSKNCHCPFTLSPRAQHPFWQLNNSTPLQKNKLRFGLLKAFIGNGAKTNNTLWSFSQIKGNLLSICVGLPAGPSLCVSGIHTSLLLFCGSAQENSPRHVHLRTGVILIPTRAGTPLVPLQMLFKVQEWIYFTVEPVLQSQLSRVLCEENPRQ